VKAKAVGGSLPHLLRFLAGGWETDDRRARLGSFDKERVDACEGKMRR
jgi:hypothetical protein